MGLGGAHGNPKKNLILHFFFLFLFFLFCDWDVTNIIIDLVGANNPSTALGIGPYLRMIKDPYVREPKSDM